MVAKPENTLTQAHPPEPLPEAEEIYRRWIAHLNDEFTRHQAAERRAEIVRDQLFQIYLGRPHGGKANLTLTSELPLNVQQFSLDPNNITLEAEHYSDVDAERFARNKPLLWFWLMFDRSPIGLNHWLGIRFRCMLGRHLFAHMGRGVRIDHGVELTYGYNLSIEDGAIVRQRALLDDRAAIHLCAGAVIGTYARIYTHTHDAQDFDRVVFAPTTIGARARVGAHTVLLAGANLREGAIVGPHGTAQGQV
uniref:Acyltransferase n=1 Tax=mine drainage metagenome TaxID=410659 RepID=E6QMQ9_9ZZZZ